MTGDVFRLGVTDGKLQVRVGSRLIEESHDDFRGCTLEVQERDIPGVGRRVRLALLDSTGEYMVGLMDMDDVAAIAIGHALLDGGHWARRSPIAEEGSHGG